MKQGQMRESGLAMLTVIVMVLGMMGISTATVMMATSRTQAIRTNTEQAQAFIMAEAAIEAAMYEVSEGVDPDGDGVGNVTRTVGGSSYAVTATSLGAGKWQLDSTGTSGNEAFSLRSVVGQESKPIFPRGALAVVGDLDEANFLVGPNANVTIDGDDAPAISVSSSDLHGTVGQEFATLINQGKLSKSDITGVGYEAFDPQGGASSAPNVALPDRIKDYFVESLGYAEANALESKLMSGVLEPSSIEGDIPFHLLSDYSEWKLAAEQASGEILLPIMNVQNYAGALHDMDAVYNSLVKTTTTLIAQADVVLDGSGSGGKGGGDKGGKDADSGGASESIRLSYGSVGQPQTVYLSQMMNLRGGDSISGYGNLVIDESVTLSSGSKLNWNGNVILTGTKGKQGDLTVMGGSLSVTGNLVMIGSGANANHVTLTVQNGGTATVDGSMFVSTSYQDGSSDQAKLNVMYGSTLDVDGVFTALGRKTKMEFLDRSKVSIDGMFQVGVPVTDGRESLKLNMMGDVSIRKDESEINNSLASLSKLGMDIGMPDFEEVIFVGEVTPYTWYPNN